MRLNDDPLVGEGERLRGATPAADGIRLRAQEAAHLVPGALLLLGFQLFAVGAGALNRLLMPEQVAFGVSGASVGLSVVLLSLVVRRRQLPVRVDEQERGARQSSLLFLAGVGALAGGLGADAFVATTKLTGWPGIGGLVGAAVLLAVSIPWF